MRCDRCGRDAILWQRYSGLRLCREHFLSSLESRAKQTIRVRGWIRTGDRIAVALSGSPAAGSLLHFLTASFGMRRDLSFAAVTVDEGNGMDMARIRALAGKRGIGWACASLARDGGGTGGIPSPGEREGLSHVTKPLDHALTSLAGEVGATKLALGTSLDTIAGSVFRRVLAGDGAGLVCDPRGLDWGIPRIEPFMRIPAEELSLYARLNSLDHVPGDHQVARDSMEDEAGRLLREYTLRHPSAMFALANLGEALLATGSGSRSRDPLLPGRRGTPGPAAPRRAPGRGSREGGHG